MTLAGTRPMPESAAAGAGGGGAGPPSTPTASVAVRTPPLYVPVMTALEFAAGAVVVTVNVAFLEPAGTSTLEGALANAGSLLESVTTAPPAGAAAFSPT